MIRLLFSAMITEHASIATVPGWARRLFENVSPFPELMCSTELYEDGDGFAFGAHFRPCAIGYLSWLSHPTVERAAFVTKEAKNRFLSGFFFYRFGLTCPNTSSETTTRS